MNKGEIMTLDITSVSSDGAGIARVGDEGYVVFARGALPGERVKVRVIKTGKRYSTAETLDIVKAAEVRRSPKCPSYGKCGGCSLQHATYGAQTAIKARILTDALRRIAGIELQKKIECEASPIEWGYRNKTSLPVRDLGGDRRFVCGYFAQGSHRVVPFRSCPVLTPSIERVIPKMIESMAKSFRGYDERAQIGDVRFLAARSGGLADESVLACAVLGRKFSRYELDRAKDIFSRLSKSIPDLAGASANFNTDPGNFIWGPVFKSLAGEQSVAQTLGSFTFETDISAFFQVNRAQAERLFAHASEAALADSPSRVLELYSGVGSLTAYLACGAESVVAVEEWRPAIRALESNMSANGITNVRGVECAVEDHLDDEDNTKPGSYDVIVLDPPRTGLPERAAAGIVRASAPKIVYVSCDPATLARDIARLLDGGYSLASIRAFDMFPQTPHVESVAVLVRNRR